MATGSGIAGRSFLIVEDEYLIALNLELALVDNGARVIGPFPRVQDALDHLVDGELPDAAILDINVGDRLVFPVAEKLEELRIPFVFATGYDKWTMPTAFAQVERLEKPTDTPRLVAALTALLGQADKWGAA